jgi:hypothetical protein
MTVRQRRSALVAVLGFVLVLGMPHAYAADDEEEDLSFEQKLMRSLLGGILTPGPEIDYRERSPLVVPPSRDLPSPDKSAAVVNNPAWPVDADVKKRKEEAKRKREKRPVNPDDEARALLPSELEVGRKAGAGRVQPGRAPTDNEVARGVSDYKGGLWSSLFSGNKKAEPVPFAGEPVRSSLIEPPTGYRTPSPNQPYGVLSDEKYTPKAFNVLDKPVGGP